MILPTTSRLVLPVQVFKVFAFEFLGVKIAGYAQEKFILGREIVLKYRQVNESFQYFFHFKFFLRQILFLTLLEKKKNFLFFSYLKQIKANYYFPL